jgi:hypothetical protein
MKTAKIAPTIEIHYLNVVEKGKNAALFLNKTAIL